jgi:hypothetical protein
MPHIMGMFGWHESNEIAAVLGIRIVKMQPNTNPLFRNSENSCYSEGEME